MQKIRSERRRVVGTAPEAYIAVRFPVRLHGVSPLALRSDIQHLLRDCKARLENIRCALGNDAPAFPAPATKSPSNLDSGYLLWVQYK